jgi:hypothetical protein
MEKPNGTPVLPLVPWSRTIDKRRESELEAENHCAVAPRRTIADARRQPRFKLEVDVRINSRTCGVLKGHSVDISESGIAAMLTIEAPLGEVVELNFTLPRGCVTIHAMVRQRNAFRYGFEFVESNAVNEVVRRTCRDLAVDQLLTLSDI